MQWKKVAKNIEEISKSKGLNSAFLKENTRIFFPSKVLHWKLKQGLDRAIVHYITVLQLPY